MLEEALSSIHGASTQLLLIKDCVASPASFLLHHLLLNDRFLSSHAPPARRPLLIFLALKEPFSHYNRIARKQGCNLQAYKDNGTLVFIDLLSSSTIDSPQTSGIEDAPSSKNKLLPLFQSCSTLLRQEQGRQAWIIIDDISLLEVLSEGNRVHVLDFIHYCRTLASGNQVCSLLLIVHEDVYETADEKAIVEQLELWADIVINVEPLATGQHRDVHGQLTVEHRMPSARLDHYGLHYKVMENGALFFAPGKQI